MRCVKIERHITNQFSSAKKCEYNIDSQAELAPPSRRLSTSLARVLASPRQSTVTKVTSTLKEKLISPVSAASTVTTPINIQAVTRGQSTRSQATRAVKVEMTTKTAPRGDTKQGGRHPHPPTGNNKKLKHMCPFDGCPWRFATPYKLRRHIKSHTKETPYLCKECGRGFSVRYNLLMHIQTIHGQPQRYKCPVRGCKEAFHSQPRLNGHLKKVHKKDVKSMEKLTPRCDSRGNSTSSMDSTGEEEATKITRQRRKYECSECELEFTSQAKLNAHSRVHGDEERPLKCSAPSCNELFASKEKLSKHLETHKNGRQFACPHENCNRVFLHQSHLKNHLKIHTKDHQFVCPVIDCSKKFSSEQDYNQHLNTHIDYNYKCTHPGCELSFMTKKRLAFHQQAIHGDGNLTIDGAQSSFLEGIQPHLGVTHQSSHLYACSPVYSYATQHDHPIKSEPSSYANTDFIKDFLPDCSQKNSETILNQNKDWSNEQIDHFLHSAIDLSEIETKLCSTGYESDSGYSTFDVSPIASHPPVTLSHPLECVPGAHLQQQHAPGPMFNPTCSFSPTTTAVFQAPTHSAASSPCSSTEAGFFSPHTDLESMATTPNQIAQFFGGDLASQGVQMYHQPQTGAMFGGAYFMEGQNCYLNSRIPDILVQSADHLERKGSNFLSCRRNSDSQVTLGESSNSMLRGQLVTRSLPNVGQLAHLVKTETYNESCSVNGHVTEVKEEIERRHSCSVSPANTSSSSFSDGRATTMKASKKSKSKSKSNPKPANQRRKNQWPRSMNKANMMAFRQHILNKLKKGQESVADSCAVKQEATSPKAMKDQEFAEQISETDSYEVQVQMQRNHSSDNRSQSEPVDGSGSPTLLVLHQSQSEGNVNKDNTTLSSCDTDTSHLTELFSDDIFNSFSFNPDSLLSRAEEEQMLKTLGFDESDDEIATFLGVGCDSLLAAGSVSNQVMDLDCIQELLDNTQVSSPLSLSPLVDASLESSVFESSSPLNSNPISQLVGSASNSLSIDFYTSTAPQYTMEGNLATVYQPSLFGDFVNCAPEVFDI